MKKTKKNIFNIILLVLATILIFMLIFVVKAFLHDLRYDEGIFYSFIQKYNFLDFLIWRYQTWSGRITGDGLAYIASFLGIWFYRILAPFCIFLTAYSIIRIYKLKFDFKIFVLTILLIGLVNYSILSSSVFWFNGFIYYLIPVSFGIYSMIIYADFYFRNIFKNNLFKIISSFFSIFIAVFANEQISLIMVVFVLVFHLVFLIKRERIPKSFYFLTVFIIICLSVSLLAPGNKLRMESELHWFPGFNSLPLTAHIKIGVFWLFDSLFNKFFLIIMALSSVPFLLKKKISKKIKFIKDVFFVQLFFIVITKLFQSPFFNFNFLYDFTFLKITYLETLKLSFSHLSFGNFFISTFPFIFWFLFLFNLLILLTNYSKNKYFTLLMFISGICSLILLWFSPTMFGSGNRVLYVCSIIWITLFVGLVCNSKLLNGKGFFLVLFIVLFCNLFPLYYHWLMNGFDVIY